MPCLLYNEEEAVEDGLSGDAVMGLSFVISSVPAALTRAIFVSCV